MTACLKLKARQKPAVTSSGNGGLRGEISVTRALGGSTLIYNKAGCTLYNNMSLYSTYYNLNGEKCSLI